MNFVSIGKFGKFGCGQHVVIDKYNNTCIYSIVEPKIKRFPTLQSVDIRMFIRTKLNNASKQMNK